MAKENGVVPQHWEKRVLAAYLLMMGETWAATSAKVGRSETTLANWHRHASWPEAKAEAERRWLYDVKDASRRAVYQQIDAGDGDLGFKVLERLDDAFAVKQKADGISPQVLQLVVQKVLVYLSDEEAHELLDFVGTQLTPTGVPRLATAPGAAATGNGTHHRP